MKITTNAQGAERKRLVQTLAKWLVVPAKYCGAPTFNYEVGAVTVDRDGALTFPKPTGHPIVLDALLQHLRDEGFGIEVVTEDSDIILTEQPTEEAVEETTEEATAEISGICISMPRNIFSDIALDNLKNLLESKGNLIKKALGVDALPILTENDMVSFPWFPGELTPEEVKAYNNFVCKLCSMAKTQKRVTAKEKEVDNEKYAFRCFLLRLGFIGAEYKEDRKILLRNLSGSSAFKSNAPAKTADLQPEPPGAYDIIPDGMDPAMAEAIADAILIQEVNDDLAGGDAE